MSYNELATYFVHSFMMFQHIYIDKVQTEEHTTVCESSSFVAVLTGKVTITIDGTAYILEPGMLLHVPKGVKLIKKSVERKPVQVAFVYYKILKEDSVPSNEYFKLQVENKEAIIHSILELKKFNEQPVATAKLKCQLLFLTLLDTIIEGVRQHDEKGNDCSIEEVLHFIHKHYREHLSVTDIADFFKIDRRYLAYIFKRYTGMSPLNYLTEYRIRRSKELLREEEYSITKVAELVGFEDNLYFSRIFKKRTGFSPSAYREAVINVHNS